MTGKTAAKFAPIFSEERRIDVSVESGETVIQLSTWTDGLGWCTQKTMTLDAELLDELHRVVTAARVKTRSRKTDDSGVAGNINKGKLLAFPSLV
jgi:hypothetical protein